MEKLLHEKIKELEKIFDELIEQRKLDYFAAFKYIDRLNRLVNTVNTDYPIDTLLEHINLVIDCYTYYL